MIDTTIIAELRSENEQLKQNQAKAERVFQAVVYAYEGKDLPEFADLREHGMVQRGTKFRASEQHEPPLLQCVDCKNTESCAGAMARMFNHGRCMHCGGYFKVVRA